MSEEDAFERQARELGRRLWDESPAVKPTWDQIGDATKGVWIERARKELLARRAAAPESPAAPGDTIDRPSAPAEGPSDGAAAGQLGLF